MKIAERILTKGGKPVATLKEHLELSHVKRQQEMNQQKKWYKELLMTLKQ